MFGNRLRVGSTTGTANGLPTVVALPREETGEIRFGDEAASSNPLTHLVLQNWKLLLGKSVAELESAATQDTVLADAFRRGFTIDRIAESYCKWLASRSAFSPLGMERLPQLIVGIPPTSETATWRANYKRRVERALESCGFPRPKFWPEPFAVFQYLLNTGAIQDTGAHQNVFILDIGGGTTNACLIQTTRHGRLSRGGVNHVPHGVRSTEVGGSTFDKIIAERLFPNSAMSFRPDVLVAVKRLKETLASQVMPSDWLDDRKLERISLPLDLDGASITLDALTLQSAFRDRLWPAIHSLIQESLSECKSKNLPTPIDTIDIVVFAGGTCQMGLVEALWKESLGTGGQFGQTEFVVCKDFRSAVAHGLVVEAAANSRHHGLIPTRVSPYIQDDIVFKCAHRRDRLECPHKLSSKARVPSDLRVGILLKAPIEITSIIGRTHSWQFELRQKSGEFFYEFSRGSGPESERLVENWKKIARRGDDRPGLQMYLDMKVAEDGFANLTFQTIGPGHERTSHEVDPIDLHELHGLEGDVFVGFDFGTDKSQCAFVRVTDPSHFEALPTKYQWDQKVEVVARDLESRAHSILNDHGDAHLILDKLSAESLTEYVYHSNRIEGSALGRGDTSAALHAAQDSRVISSSALQAAMSRLGAIDQSGQIIPVDRLLSDRVAAVNLRDAFEFVQELARDKDRDLNQFDLRQIHSLVMRGEAEAHPGAFRRHPVRISQTTFVPPDSSQVEPLIEEMFRRFAERSFMALPSLVQSTEAHARFVSIHPFADGNGRVARLLANYFLWRTGLPGLLLPWENRDRYYDALEECNSREPTLRGDLSDLIRLFCDVFEDSLEHIAEGQDMPLATETESVVVDVAEPDTEFGRLLQKLSRSKRALSAAEQYENWKNAMEGIRNDLRECTNQLSGVFSSKWGGSVRLDEYPIIDMDTYFSIRRKQRFSRTWFSRIRFELPKSVEEIVLWFGPNSRDARLIDQAMAFTCSLNVSYLDRGTGRHMSILNARWSRVCEILHDGSRMAVLVKSGDAGSFSLDGENLPRTQNWFGVLLEDILRRFGGDAFDSD